MIRSIKVELNAAFPNMPLLPFHVFHGSAAAITVLNVPRRIVSLSVKVKNVSAVDRVFPAQRSGSAWVAVIPGSFFEQSGTSTRGVRIEGVDEAGNIYTLGAADLVVMLDNGSVEPVSPTPSVLGKLPLRALPKYLHYIAFDDTYPADAQAFYDSIGGARVMGGCSIVRKGGLVGGNFDYPYDDACTFAIKVSAAKGANADGSYRHASVGAAYLGMRLTENIVSSGVSTPLYRVLPGMTESGINDAGVYAKINVIPRDDEKDPDQSTTRNLHALAVVRYVLDHFDSAEDAAEYIAAHYYIPEGSSDSYHWMIADKDGTFIVEDGEVASNEETRLTNVRIVGSDPYGNGVIRYDLLGEDGTVAELLESVKFTNAYATGWPWPDEFAGMTDAQGKIPQDATERLKAWAEAHVAPLLDENRKPAERGNGCWQTVHSAIYDFEKKTMAICIQEDFSKRYIFAVDQANVDLTPIEERIASLQGGKRDLTDEDAYKRVQCNDWTFSGSDYDPTATYTIQIDLDNNDFNLYKNGEFLAMKGESLDSTEVDFSTGGFMVNIVATRPTAWTIDTDTAHKLAKRAATPISGALAKFDADGNLVDAEKSSTSADPANADYRDPQDNEAHADSFTPWVDTDGNEVPSSKLYWENGFWCLHEFHVGDDVADPPEGLDFNATILKYQGEIVAKRAKCATTGESFVTHSFVTGLVNGVKTLLGSVASPFTSFSEWIASKFDTAKAVPEFSSTATYEAGEIVLHDGVVYKCTAAITTAGAWTGSANWTAATDADLAARLKGLKSDGTATDTFATDLLGKPVAISAMRYALGTAITASAKLADRTTNFVNALSTLTDPIDLTFPDLVTGKCRDFLVRVHRATGGVAVSFTAPTGAVVYGDGFSTAIGENEDWLFAITETAANEWYVRAIKLEVAA